MRIPGWKEKVGGREFSLKNERMKREREKGGKIGEIEMHELVSLPVCMCVSDINSLEALLSGYVIAWYKCKNGGKWGWKRIAQKNVRPSWTGSDRRKGIQIVKINLILFKILIGQRWDQIYQIYLRNYLPECVSEYNIFNIFKLFIFKNKYRSNDASI